MDFGMLIEVKTELIQGSIDLNIIGTDSHRAPPVSFLTTVARIPSPIGEGMNCTFEHVCSNS